jgi:hypothetical protein
MTPVAEVAAAAPMIRAAAVAALVEAAAEGAAVLAAAANNDRAASRAQSCLSRVWPRGKALVSVRNLLDS